MSACCKPISRTTPSGAKRFHSKFCKVHPNERIQPSTPLRRIEPGRAEVASHAVRERLAEERARDEEYMDFWSDTAFEQQERR